ncbi:DUF2029 domain-containing protein [Roseibium sp. CAU 1637]|uniref:DUF2029 domain-containing protein n=1 Tax=Roseibium limicola TaxID=2816037 RepID=A0A939EQ12_9HYPH|nr:glycosyltransferase family 87 protein [Roseibium limicola]MBO0345856.1 DUF2029 domain-containing protein [Roseibium limicola]
MSWIQHARRGTWATRDRVLPAAIMALVTYCFLLVFLFLAPGKLSTPDLSATTNDFLSFWVAAKSAVQGDPVTPYVIKDFAFLQQESLGEGRFYSFFYPPVFLLYLLPLGVLSGVAAYFAFQIVTIIATGASLSAILGSRYGFLLAAALPLTMTNAVYGQNGMLSAAFLGAALAALAVRREILAGFFIALLIYKPQLGILIPFALIAGGHWRIFASASVCALLLIGLSVLVLGGDAWLAFWEQREFASGVVAEGLVDLHKFISISAGAGMLGAPTWLAYGLQAIVSLSVLALVVWTWNRRSVDFADKVAVLTAGSLLATPFALCYDFAILCVPIAFFMARRKRQGAADWEDGLMFLTVLLATISRVVGEMYSIPLGPLACLVFLAIPLRRIVLGSGVGKNQSPSITGGISSRSRSLNG